MAFSLDPTQLVSDAITKLVNSSVIVGMPTKDNPVPLFCLCEIPEEQVSAGARLPGISVQSGEMRSRVVIEPSRYEITAVIADFDGKNTAAFKVVQTALSAIASLSNSVASFGAVIPNLSNLTTGYVSSQVSVLNQIKNNGMPIMLLGAYFSLGVVQQATPYLLSKWYIEKISAPHTAGKAGTSMTITFVEQVEPRDTTLEGGVKALLGEIGSPLAGQVAGGLF